MSFGCFGCTNKDDSSEFAGEGGVQSSGLCGLLLPNDKLVSPTAP